MLLPMSTSYGIILFRVYHPVSPWLIISGDRSFNPSESFRLVLLRSILELGDKNVDGIDQWLGEDRQKS